MTATVTMMTDGYAAAGVVVLMLAVMLVPRMFAARMLREDHGVSDALKTDPDVVFACAVLEAYAFAPTADKERRMDNVMYAHPTSGERALSIALLKAGTLRAIWRAGGHLDFTDAGVDHGGTFVSPVSETEMLRGFFAHASARGWFQIESM